MEGRSILPLILATVLLCISAGNSTASLPPTDFIRSSCKSTRYPALCMDSLSSYAPAVHRSPRQLARAALAVSAARARDVSSFVSRLSSPPGAGARSMGSKSGGAVRDCLETLGDTVDRLQRSVKEMNRMGRVGSDRFNWHFGNVQTWVSAALTDENTCLDSLQQDAKTAKIRAQIRKRIVAVAQVTSNALALVNRIPGRN